MVGGILERSSTLVDAPGRKVVLLTGASGTIGTAFCERFAARYDIIAVRHQRPLKVASQLQSYFDPFVDGSPSDDHAVFEIRADLRNKAEVDRVVEVGLARFGRIDAIVNAVGMVERGRDVLGAALRRAPEVFQANVMIPMNVAAAVAVVYWRHHDLENAARNRVVVNLSAASSVDATDRSFGPTVGATKAALNLLSLHLAEELRPFDVRVVTVAPAPVPEVVKPDRVTSAIAAMIEGKETGRLLLMWDEDDELV